MKWSNFTTKYMEQYKKQPYEIANNNILLEQIKKEREDICQFIKTLLTKNPIKITKETFLEEKNSDTRAWGISALDFFDHLNAKLMR